MAAIKNVIFVKRFDDIRYVNKTLELVNTIASIVDDEVLKKIEGYWPDFYSLSFKTEDFAIVQDWPVDAVTNDFHSRADNILAIQSGETLILFDVKIYESYPPLTRTLYQAIVNDGVKTCTLDDLFK